MNTATDMDMSGQGGALDVSVVVPSYNHAQFVEECLRSIMQQTRSPRELIVIDDGSSDGSPRVIEQVLKNCPFSCELIVRPNRGVSATLNEGLRRSRGDYFAYLGSDDVWLPSFLQARVALLESRSEAVLAYGHVYVFDQLDRIIECTSDWANYIDGDARRMLLWSTTPPSPTVLYRRKPLERHGWNEQAKLEDYELYLRLSAEGEFAFDPQVLAAWRQHERNTSRDLSLMMHQSQDAQRQVAGILGLCPRELDEIQLALRWKYIEEFMRRGQKRKALALMCGNLRGAASVALLTRLLLRLTIPYRIMRWRRHLSQQQAHKSYGKVRT
ncbi:MAG: glycosyltransferase [Acidobacteria bacterium]|nr:glycosyltransferase [Acidobacteriota bacterium]